MKQTIKYGKTRLARMKRFGNRFVGTYAHTTNRPRKTFVTRAGIVQVKEDK